jgi:hypothetical protein
VHKQKRPEPYWFRAFEEFFGGDLLSHTASHAVPSALRGLTSVFGMGTGVSPSPLPPKTLNIGLRQFGLVKSLIVELMSIILWPSRTTY